jgi:hypothetical protein
MCRILPSKVSIRAMGNRKSELALNVPYVLLSISLHCVCLPELQFRKGLSGILRKMPDP